MLAHLLIIYYCVFVHSRLGTPRERSVHLIFIGDEKHHAQMTALLGIRTAACLVSLLFFDSCGKLSASHLDIKLIILYTDGSRGFSTAPSLRRYEM
jgi:hypothetical protein